MYEYYHEPTTIIVMEGETKNEANFEAWGHCWTVFSRAQIHFKNTSPNQYLNFFHRSIFFNYDKAGQKKNGLRKHVDSNHKYIYSNNGLECAFFLSIFVASLPPPCNNMPFFCVVFPSQLSLVHCRGFFYSHSSTMYLFDSLHVHPWSHLFHMLKILSKFWLFNFRPSKVKATGKRLNKKLYTSIYYHYEDAFTKVRKKEWERKLNGNSVNTESSISEFTKKKNMRVNKREIRAAIVNLCTEDELQAKWSFSR